MDKYSGDARITEEALERLRKQIGVERDARPWASLMSFDTARHYAQYCLGSDNPLWLDPEYGARSVFGAPMPPPTAEYVACSADKRLGGPGLPGIFALHAEDEWIFYTPVRIGDVLRARIKLAEMDVRESRWGGRSIWQTVEIAFFNPEGTRVSVYRPTTVRAERPRAREQKKYEPREPHRYTDAEMVAIFRDYEAEAIRGAEPRYVEDVRPGDSLGHVVKGPLAVMDLMCWWIGAGGPYVQAFKQRYLIQKQYPTLAIRDPRTNIPRSPEDAHFDVDYARHSGVGEMYDIGRQRTVSVVHLATNWCGDTGRLGRLKMQFTLPNYTGDTTWYRGQVQEVDVATGRVVVAVWGENQRGERHTTGTVEIVLPRRGGL